MSYDAKRSKCEQLYVLNKLKTRNSQLTTHLKHPAINRNNLPGDIGSHIRCQENTGIGYLFSLATPFKRDRLRPAFHYL